MGAELTQALALGVGASGALVAIDNTLVRYEAGVAHVEGRSDAFRADTPPGTLTVTLDNYDGRFTPDNTAAAIAAGYSTALTEGSAVCWSRGGKLWAGTIRGFEPADEWGLVTLTCDDMLGVAARTTVPSLDSQVAQLIAGWSLNDAPAATQAVGYGATPLLISDTSSGLGSYSFGTGLSTPRVSSALTITAGSGGAPAFNAGGMPPYTYPSDSMGSWGFWFMATGSSGSGAQGLVVVNYASSSIDDLGLLRISIDAKSFTPNAAVTLGAASGTNNASVSSMFFTPGQPNYISASITTSTVAGNTVYTLQAFLNGVSYGSATLTPATNVAARTNRTATSVQVGMNNLSTVANSFTIARLYHSPAPLTESFAATSTEGARLQAIASLASSLSLDTLPANLSTATIGDETDQFSLLDAFNDVMFAEQGYIYTATSGTITAPTQKIEIRDRDRPASTAITSSNTFDALSEIKDRPRFMRDLTYTVSSATATGGGGSGTYTDPNQVARVGTANSSDASLLYYPSDLFTWASDRVVRGANVGLRAVSVEIDSLTTSTSAGVANDRSADLLALKLGDRIRVANIPSGPTGFTTWDGWIVGIQERYVMASQGSENTFTFLVTPCLPDTAIYDTNRYMAGGNLSLGSTITAGASSISIVSSDGTLFTTSGGDFPINITIDSEVVTLSGASGASSPQTGTVSARGVSGTTATSHTSATLLDLTTASLYAF
jgi:hypothetical protein